MGQQPSSEQPQDPPKTDPPTQQPPPPVSNAPTNAREDQFPDEVDFYPDTFRNTPEPSDEQLAQDANIMNRNEYRSYTSRGIPDYVGPEVRETAQGVGMILKSEYLARVPGGYMIQTDSTDGQRITIIAKTVGQNANEIAKKATFTREMQATHAADPENNGKFGFVNNDSKLKMGSRDADNPPQLPPNYKFANDLCLSHINPVQDMLGGCGTVFHLGNGIIATAAHTIIGKDWKQFRIVFDFHQDYFDAPFQIIPKKQVFRIKRLICGQEGVKNDRLDWVLLQLVPNNSGSDWPFVLKLMPPERYQDVFLYKDRLFTIGHPWGTSAKLSYPDPNNKAWRQLLNKNPYSVKDFTYTNSILHNLMIRVGNSGGPICISHPDPDLGVVVIACQGNLNRPGQAIIEKFGFYPKKASRCLSLITPENRRCLSVATKSSIWAHALNPNSNISILCVVPPKCPTGTLVFRLRLKVLLDNNGSEANVRCVVGYYDVGKGKANAFKIICPLSKVNLVPKVSSLVRVMVRPANIVALDVAFIPSEDQPPASSPAKIIPWTKDGKYSEYKFPTNLEAVGHRFDLDQLVVHVEGPNDPNNRFTRLVITRLWEVPIYKIRFPDNDVDVLGVTMVNDEWLWINTELRDAVQGDENKFQSLKVEVHNVEFPQDKN